MSVRRIAPLVLAMFMLPAIACGATERDRQPAAEGVGGAAAGDQQGAKRNTWGNHVWEKAASCGHKAFPSKGDESHQYPRRANAS